MTSSPIRVPVTDQLLRPRNAVHPGGQSTIPELQAVWGGQYGSESDYVWTFVQRIRRKIEPDRTHPRYILTEPGVGYRMPAPEYAYAGPAASGERAA